MFRSNWNEIEKKISKAFTEAREELFEKVLRSKKNQVFNVTRDDVKQRKEDFLLWGQDYIQNLKVKAGSEKVAKAKENFLVLLRNFGVNDELLVQAFAQNKKELLDPLIGEVIAIVALVLGWSQKDKEAFSQALGEIGVIGVFAAKPFICLIAICGLAYGYHRNFHQEAFKKGGVLGFAGLTAAALSPGGFVGLLAAIVTILFLNKKISVERSVESQLKEIFNQIRSGVFFKEVRESWRQFEGFLSKLFVKSDKQSKEMEPVH